jgi:hypothetical protein
MASLWSRWRAGMMLIAARIWDPERMMACRGELPAPHTIGPHHWTTPLDYKQSRPGQLCQAHRPRHFHVHSIVNGDGGCCKCARVCSLGVNGVGYIIRGWRLRYQCSPTGLGRKWVTEAWQGRRRRPSAIGP